MKQKCSTNTPSDSLTLFVHQGHELYGSDRMFLLNVKAYCAKYPERSVDVVLPASGPLADAIHEETTAKVQIKSIGVLRRYDLKRFNLLPLFSIITFFRLIPFLRRYSTIFINSVVVVDFILATRYSRATAWVHVHELQAGGGKILFSKILNFSKANIIFVSKAAQSSYVNLTGQVQHILWNGCKPLKKVMSAQTDELFLHLLIIGRINRWKGHTLLLDAINTLPENVKNKVKLSILGDVYGKQNHLKDELHNLIIEYKLENRVEMLPFSQDPAEQYNRADIVVVPSIHPESFGLVAIESMSIGKPVIAANHGGITEIVVDGETGILFEAGNPQSLAEAITYFIENREKLSEMGEKGRVRYQENFTEEHYIERLGIVLQQKKL